MLFFFFPLEGEYSSALLKISGSQKPLCITQQDWIYLCSVDSQLGGIISFMAGEMGGRQEKVIKSVNELTIPKGIKLRKA